MIDVQRRTAEIVTALVLLAAIVFLYIHTYTFAPSPMRGYPGAAFLPRLILIYAGAFTAIWLAGLVFWYPTPGTNSLIDAEDDRVFEFEYRDYLITIVAILAFVFGTEEIGFEATSFLVFAVLLYSRLSSIAMVVLVSLLSTLVCYLVFVLLLNVSLPLAFLPAYINY